MTKMAGVTQAKAWFRKNGFVLPWQKVRNEQKNAKSCRKQAKTREQMQKRSGCFLLIFFWPLPWPYSGGHLVFFLFSKLGWQRSWHERSFLSYSVFPNMPSLVDSRASLGNAQGPNSWISPIAKSIREGASSPVGRGPGESQKCLLLPECPFHTTVGTKIIAKIIADPEKCFQGINFWKITVFFCGMGPVWK